MVHLGASRVHKKGGPRDLTEPQMRFEMPTANQKKVNIFRFTGFRDAWSLIPYQCHKLQQERSYTAMAVLEQRC